MEYRPLEITLISAKDLKNVNLFSKMNVYAIVSLSGDPRTRLRTPVDHTGRTNPTWNFNLKFTIDENQAMQNHLILVFKLRCERSLGDRDVGEVQVPVKDLLDNLGDHNSPQFVSYQVRKPSGKAQGVLNFSYKFGDKVVPKALADEPVTAYPAYPPHGMTAGASSDYPPRYPSQQQPVGYAQPPMAEYGGYPTFGGRYAPPPVKGYDGYLPSGGYAQTPLAGYPPPSGYAQPLMASYGGYPQPPVAGYPPPSGYAQPPMTGYGGHPLQQQGGYGGYPPQGGPGHGAYPPQKPPKNNKMGMGLGAGLLGGALGGLLIGDMISDAGDYGGGFDDSGGFDF